MYKFKLEKEENIRLLKANVRKGHIPHTHDFIEIVYISRGSGKHSINDASYPVSRGDLLFINFKEVHSYSTVDSMEYINCLISPGFLSEELVNSENAMDIFRMANFREFYDLAGGICPKISFRGAEMLEIELIFDAMMVEYANKEAGFITVLKSYVNILLTKIFRNLDMPEHEGITSNLNRITPEVLQYIRENYNKKITLKEMAKMSFYNPNYFSAIFKECYGKTPLEYISAIRMDEAVKLMNGTVLSIEEISHRIGYCNKKHFYKLFREKTGLTPNEFRTMRKQLPVEDSSVERIPFS